MLKYKKGIVLRTNIYGFNIQDKCSFGEWILSAMQKNEMLRMVEDVRFSPILVNDVADVLIRLLKKRYLDYLMFAQQVVFQNTILECIFLMCLGL